MYVTVLLGLFLTDLWYDVDYRIDSYQLIIQENGISTIECSKDYLTSMYHLYPGENLGILSVYTPLCLEKILLRAGNIVYAIRRPRP